MIRKFLQEGLDGYLDRIFTLEQAPAVVPPPPGGESGTSLRFGLANFADNVGKGPMLNSTAPIYKFSQMLSIAPSSVNNYIALADAADVWFMFAPSGGRGRYINTSGQFDRKMYQDSVRRFEGNATLDDAINRKRVLLWVFDEANHPSFNGTCDPDDLNWCANLHKKIWPGALTFVRMGTSTLVNGWNAKGIPSGGWTGIDYGWEQRSGQHNSEDFPEFYSTRKAQLADLDLGMIPGLNWWAGGVWGGGQVLSGVGGCWNATLANPPVSQIIIGANNRSTSPNSDFDIIPCNQWNSLDTKAVVSPDLLPAWARVVVQDTDAPFSMLWQWPVNGSLGASSTVVATQLAQRADYVAALTETLNILNARPTWSGWRTAKPGDPVIFLA